MSTWKDVIVTGLIDNDESWECVVFTTFSDKELRMSPYQDVCGEFFHGYSVAAYTSRYLYTVEWGKLYGTLFINAFPLQYRDFTKTYEDSILLETIKQLTDEVRHVRIDEVTNYILSMVYDRTEDNETVFDDIRTRLKTVNESDLSRLNHSALLLLSEAEESSPYSKWRECCYAVVMIVSQEMAKRN